MQALLLTAGSSRWQCCLLICRYICCANSVLTKRACSFFFFVTETQKHCHLVATLKTAASLFSRKSFYKKFINIHKKPTQSLTRCFSFFKVQFSYLSLVELMAMEAMAVSVMLMQPRRLR